MKDETGSCRAGFWGRQVKHWPPGRRKKLFYEKKKRFFFLNAFKKYFLFVLYSVFKKKEKKKHVDIELKNSWLLLGYLILLFPRVYHNTYTHVGKLFCTDSEDTVFWQLSSASCSSKFYWNYLFVNQKQLFFFPPQIVFFNFYWFIYFSTSWIQHFANQISFFLSCKIWVFTKWSMLQSKKLKVSVCGGREGGVNEICLAKKMNLICKIRKLIC